MTRRSWITGAIGAAVLVVSCGTTGLKLAHRSPDSGGVIAPRVVPTSNVGVSFAIGNRLHATFASSPAIHATTALPVTADAPFVVSSLHDRAGNFDVSVSLVGAKSPAPSIEHGLVHYREALGPGTDLMHRVTPDGTEDYVTLDGPQRSELHYRIVLGDGVAGLRLIGDSLELLEADGTPRLRVNAPYGIDAEGKTFAARLAVADCAFDTSPAAPWGRPLTRPGAKVCSLVITWNAVAAYPIVIDPAWTATNNPAFPTTTYEDFLVRLSGGKALYAADSEAQLFDPVTNTWANTGSPTFDLVHRSRLLAVGGNKAWAMENTGSSTSLYDLATGTWTATSPRPMDYYGPALAYLGGSKVLVISAEGEAYIYDVDSDTYVTKSVGGYIGANPGAFQYAPNKFAVGGLFYANLALYDVAADTWSYSVPQILGAGDATDCFNAESLTDGTLLLYGDCGAGNTAAIYDPTKDTVTPVAMPTAAPIGCQCGHQTGVSYGKVHYIAGGRFVYDESAGAISDLGVFDSAAVNHGAVVKLLDGRSLAVGGSDGYPNGLADLLTATSSTDCAIFGAPGRPVFDSTSRVCTACDGDNNGAAPHPCPSAGAPACQEGAKNRVLGSCTQCSATNTVLCGASTPACHDDGSCVAASGDNGTAPADTCPRAENPYARKDGTCGRCASNPDCAGASHAGPICNIVSGACGSTCANDSDCAPTSYCDKSVSPPSCSPRREDGGADASIGAADAGAAGNMGGADDAPDAASQGTSARDATGSLGGCSSSGRDGTPGDVLLAMAVITLCRHRHRHRHRARS